MARAGGAAALRAPLKLIVIASVWVTLLVGLYIMAHQGLRFVYTTAAGLGPFLMDRLWYLFLFVISIMLVVSQWASAYSTLVRAPETRWWMSLPISTRTIGRAKWIESSGYSAWAVVLLGVPLALAYLVVLGRPVWLFGWIALLLLPLLAIATALSTVILLLWLRWCGRLALRREVIAVGFVAACGVLFWLLGERQKESGGQDVWFLALQDVLPRMQIAMAPWLPSSWVAKAISAGLNNRWMEGGLYAVLLSMTALLAWRLCDHVGAALVVPVLQKQGQPVEPHWQAQSAASPTRHVGRHPARASDSSTIGGVDRASRGVAAPFSTPWWMRHPFLASLMKDLLLVIRDPMQWSQAVVFFGLLGAYFANIHRLSQISAESAWRVGIASLNLACTLLVFGSLAVRFLFPGMSLEGRRLWLLRVAPAGIRHLMVAKLTLYGAFAVVIIEGLLWLSTGRLGIPMPIRWWLAAVGAIAAVTLVGMTVGLGARWIDPSAQDAARVVSSSRGVLALVLMLGYVGCVVGALVIAWSGWLSPSLGWVVPASTAGLVAVSALAGWLPVRLGLATLNRLER